jgi:hypothetical protein
MNYTEFIHQKSQWKHEAGFEPTSTPDFLFDFQRHLFEYACRKGRSAIFADCGLGKTAIELAFGQEIVQRENKPVLLLTPLAVGQQVLREAAKFGIDAIDGRKNEFNSVPSIWVANYEILHKFSPSDFCGLICDESSILKNIGGATQKQLTRFIAKLPYRMMATATPSPNDYVELGTTSEALGQLNNSDMLKRFFRQLDDKGQKQETKKQEEAERLITSDPSYFQKLSYRVSQSIGQWRLKHHAKKDFWRWVSSWAIACRTPSDLGFSDDGYRLPELREHDHIIEPDSPPPDFLFNIPAIGLQGEREERKRTLNQRCEYAASLVEGNDAAVVWCHSNAEGDLLEQVIPNAKQIAGRTPDEEKIETYEAFASGELKKLVIKPKIGAWGLNWQHCNTVVTFASHSYEQHYQAVRRCYRFGQKRPVDVHVIATEGEVRVLGNMRKKATKAELMFSELVAAMNQTLKIETKNIYTKKAKVPQWLLQTN